MESYMSKNINYEELSKEELIKLLLKVDLNHKELFICYMNLMCSKKLFIRNLFIF